VYNTILCEHCGDWTLLLNPMMPLPLGSCHSMLTSCDDTLPFLQGYTPRAPLSALLAKQGAIQATEDNDDTQILDAIASADCVASVAAQ
jgi:hypothetical protein